MKKCKNKTKECKKANNWYLEHGIISDIPLLEKQQFANKSSAGKISIVQGEAREGHDVTQSKTPHTCSHKNTGAH